MDFLNRITESSRTVGTSPSIIFNTKNEYDHANRLIAVIQNTGGADVIVSQNEYNAVGQLLQTSLHEGGELINYKYNINTMTYLATMEENRSEEENTYFANIESTRAGPYNYPDHNPLNQKLAKLPGKSRGPSIMLQVMAGDTISISAKAFYNIDKSLPDKGVDVAPILGSAIAAMTNPTGKVIGEAAQLAADLGAEASQSVSLMQVPKNNDKEKSPQPKSGINFVAYNHNFDIVEANTGVQVVDDKINTIQTLSTDQMIMKEAGFIEIFANI